MATITKNEGDQYDKAKAIWAGVSLKCSSYNGPPKDFRAHYSSEGYRLAILLQHLTSTKKEDREKAKTEIRELVRLGKEATE